MTDNISRAAVEAVLVDHAARWQERQAASPPAHKFDLTTEAASKLAVMDVLHAIRSIPPVEGDGWQPIETARKDGGPIWAFMPGGFQTCLVFKEGRWRVAGWPLDYGSAWEPTHWRAIADPPAALSPQSPTGETE